MLHTVPGQLLQPFRSSSPAHPVELRRTASLLQLFALDKVFAKIIVTQGSTLSAGPCLSTRQGWARETTHPRSDIRSKIHHAAAAAKLRLLGSSLDILPLMASLFRS